jgi:NAD(P) transhydrogenase
MVERGSLGGVCVNTGTIPSKSMREAVVYLTGVGQRELYGASYRVKERITWADLYARTERAIKREIDVVRNQLIRNSIELYTGHARFIDEHTVLVESPNCSEHTAVSGQYIIIATGTTPVRPPGVQFDDERVIDSDGILHLKKIPSSMVVVGAGVIGIEYASIFAALGTKVTVVDKRDAMLGFCDNEIIEALQLYLRDLSVTFRFDEEVTAVDIHRQGTITTLASGKQIAAETVMYSAADKAALSSSVSRTLDWTPIATAGSRWTTPPAPTSSTSMPSATSSDSPHLPLPPWSRVGSPRPTHFANL